jgi:PhzF family phenazine biosynthesis protein
LPFPGAKEPWQSTKLANRQSKEKRMRIPYYHIDAFTDGVFRGNPAGVCLLESWLDDKTLQAIAAENNLSETAFLVGADGRYALRWFTPEIEVDLCGHATLAAAHALILHVGETAEVLEFESQSGPLRVHQLDDMLTLDFPARPGDPISPPEALQRGLGAEPAAVLKARDIMAVFETEAQVKGLRPDMAALAGLDCLGVIVTAPGDEADFVSRFFAPRAGIPEDPVTGSAHCTLAPYWAARLGRTKLRARQVSVRGGELRCELAGGRVFIGGKAVTYLEGAIEI